VFAGNDDEVGVEVLRDVEDGAAGVLAEARPREADRGGVRDGSLGTEVAGLVDERALFLGDGVGLDVAGFQPAGDRVVDDVEDVDCRVVAVCERTGVGHGLLGAVARVDWHEDQFGFERHRPTVGRARAKSHRGRVADRRVAGRSAVSRAGCGAFMTVPGDEPHVYDTVVIATDGSESATRAVDVALELAERFDATVHALYVVDEGDVAGSPDELREELADALAAAADEALGEVRERADRDVATAVREGRPAPETTRFAADVDADVVALGTRGRHGNHGYLLGSVAEAVVRRCSRPVLTVRQLYPDDAETDDSGVTIV